MVRYMITPVLTMLLLGPVDIARDLWHFWDFRNNLPVKYRWRPNKVRLTERGAPGTVPYGKSNDGYCITFIKKLDKAWRQQL